MEHAVSFLESWLAYRAAQEELNFCVTIRSADAVVFSQAFGYADRDKSRPLRTDHLYYSALLLTQDSVAVRMALDASLRKVRFLSGSQGQEPEIPRVMTNEEAVVKRFLFCLGLPATRAAIVAQAETQRDRKLYEGYVTVLARCKSMRDVVEGASALEVIWVALIGTEIVPKRAIPSFECVSAAKEALEAWIDAQA